MRPVVHKHMLLSKPKPVCFFNRHHPKPELFLLAVPFVSCAPVYLCQVCFSTQVPEYKYGCFCMCLLGGVGCFLSLPHPCNTRVFPIDPQWECECACVCVCVCVIYFMVHTIHMILRQGCWDLMLFFCNLFCFIWRSVYKYISRTVQNIKMK